MSTTKLFDPLQLGRIKLAHRVVMAPLSRRRADGAHVQLPMAIEYYTQRASSLAGGLIITEATIIRPEHGGAAHMPGIWSDAQIARWRDITDAVHAKGGYIFCQLISLGRVANVENLKAEGNYPLVSSGNIPFPEGNEATPRPLTICEIGSTLSVFANAAGNAIAAGFDGVEIHGANGYLVDQFLQDTCNNRTDSYGGSVANRARFAIEVTKAISNAIGSDRVAFRISPFSTFQGMKMDEPVPQFSYLVEQLKELKIAYLHIIESRVINNVDCEKHEGIEPFLDIWGRTSPVLVAGGFTPDMGRHAVDVEYSSNDVAVVFGRHFLANPDLPYRIRHGLVLNSYDRSTFYSPMQKNGYVTYPFSEEFQKENGNSA